MGEQARLTTPAGLTEVPAVRRAAALAAELLAPRAAEVEAGGVPRSHLDALADAGLLGLPGDAEPAVVREVGELLAAADGATAFVAAQHRSPLRAVETSDAAPVREAWLGPLRTGRAVGAVAFSHLRRPGPPRVTATPVDGGYRIDGTADWVTGWGIADVLLLAAVTPTAQIVWALVPLTGAAPPPGPAAPPAGSPAVGAPPAGLRATAALPLAAMEATRTVRLDVDGLVVRGSDVARLEPLAAWATVDHRTTANGVPAVFGIVRGALGLLELRAPEEAAELAGEAAQVRAAAYRLLDEVDPAQRLEERLALRAQALDLAVRSTAALVAATSGPAMTAGAPEQRLAREALFFLVQASTPASRAAVVSRLAGPR